MAAGPKILSRETLHEGYLTVLRLRVRLADGAQAVRESATRGDAVAVLPYDPARRCALVVRLFRAPVLDAGGQAALEEACAGMIERGDSAEETARREAGEELGVRLDALEPVARTWSSPGVSSERIALYLAPYAETDRAGRGGGLEAEHELVTAVERPLADLAAESEVGAIADAKLLMLVQALRLRRPELFA